MRKMLFLVWLILTIIAPVEAQEIVEEGMASFYANKYEGRFTASGEKYKHSKLTAAHKFLPFGTLVEVTNKSNGKSVIVKINDRGPYVDGRIIDLSKSAAEKLDMIGSGLAEVTIKIIDPGDGKGNQYNTSSPTYVDTPDDEKEFYEFSVSRTNPSGYGVQIGSYLELANLIRLADNLRSSYKKKIIVQVSVINGIKYYKIIVGAEKTRDKADQLKKKLQKKYPDSFVVMFTNI